MMFLFDDRISVILFSTGRLNPIMAFSNIFALFPIIYSISDKEYAIGFLSIIVMIFSFVHQLFETREDLYMCEKVAYYWNKLKNIVEISTILLSMQYILKIYYNFTYLKSYLEFWLILAQNILAVAFKIISISKNPKLNNKSIYSPMNCMSRVILYLTQLQLLVLLSHINEYCNKLLI